MFIIAAGVWQKFRGTQRKKEAHRAPVWPGWEASSPAAWAYSTITLIWPNLQILVVPLNPHVLHILCKIKSISAVTDEEQDWSWWVSSWYGMTHFDNSLYQETLVFWVISCHSYKADNVWNVKPQVTGGLKHKEGLSAEIVEMKLQIQRKS